MSKTTLIPTAARLGLIALGGCVGPFAALGLAFAGAALSEEAVKAILGTAWAGWGQASGNVFANLSTDFLKDFFGRFRTPENRNFDIERGMSSALTRALEELRSQHSADKEWFDSWRLKLAKTKDEQLRAAFAGGGGANNAILLSEHPDAWWPHMEAVLRRWKAEHDSTLQQMHLSGLPEMPDALRKLLKEEIPRRVPTYFNDALKHNDLARWGFQQRFFLHLSAKLDLQHSEVMTELADVRSIIEELRDHCEEFRTAQHTRLAEGQMDLALIPRRALLRTDAITTERDIVDAGYRSIPMVGRDDDLREVLAWIGNTDRFSILPIIGPAGAGKTRFALELLERIENEFPDWRAGFATKEIQAAYPKWEKGQKLLIVFDYAASQFAVVKETIQRMHVLQPHARILLLERHGSIDRNSWLGQLWDETNTGRVLAKYFQRPKFLEPLHSEESSPVVLRATLHAASEHLGRPIVDFRDDDAALKEQLKRELWRDPLCLMMAGVLWSSDGRADAMGMHRTDLAIRMADREKDRLRSLAADHSEGFKKLVLRLAALATLTGDREQARGLREQESLDAAQAESQDLGLQTDLHEAVELCRRGLGFDSTTKTIPPITPDIIGEAFMLDVFESGAAIERALKCVGVDRLVPAIIQAAQNFSSPAGTGARELRPLQWIDVLLGHPKVEVLLALARGLPQRQSLALTQISTKLYRTLLRLASSDEERARVAINLSVNLSWMGARGEGLKSAQEAVEIYSKLSQANPDAYLADLAMSLHNLGAMESGVGARGEGLKSAQEAVEIRRKLSQANPDAYLADLAMSLNNLGAMESGMGARGEGLKSAQEAVEIYRKLSQANPDTYLPDLARSLDNFGTTQSEMGIRGEALKSAQEAVEIYRKLSQANPDTYLPDLAMSLHNLGARQLETGARGEALKSAQEAVEIRRKLSQANPDAYLPDLAMSLNNLGTMESGMGALREALKSAQEAVEIYSKLSQANPDAYLPDLAMSLNNLGLRQSEMGARGEGLKSAQEAVDIRRKLSQANPDAYLPALASSLHNWGTMQSKMGARGEGLKSVQEAAEIRRKLSQANPDAHLPDLAMSLSNLGARQLETGARGEGLKSAKEAVEIYSKLSQANPDAYLPDLAMSLHNLGTMESETGARGEALKSAQEAVEIYSKLSQANPDAYLPDLAMSLNNLGIRQSEMGARAEGLKSAQEAVEIRRKLSQANPDAYLPDLAWSLGTLSQILAVVDRHKERTAALAEAIRILAPSFNNLPRGYSQLMGKLCRGYLKACTSDGSVPDVDLLDPVVETLERIQDDEAQAT